MVVVGCAEIRSGTAVPQTGVRLLATSRLVSDHNTSGVFSRCNMLAGLDSPLTLRREATLSATRTPCGWISPDGIIMAARVRMIAFALACPSALSALLSVVWMIAVIIAARLVRARRHQLLLHPPPKKFSHHVTLNIALTQPLRNQHFPLFRGVLRAGACRFGVARGNRGALRIVLRHPHHGRCTLAFRAPL